jgi:hypothetical protein
MEDDAGTYKLLAMPAAGEAVLVQDDRQRVWLIRFARQYQQKQATVDDVDIAINNYGWEHIGRSFRSWDALDEYRLSRAAEGVANLPDREIADYDRRYVEVLLRQVAKAGPERRTAAINLLTDLALRCRAVRGDDGLANLVAEQLDDLRQPPPVMTENVVLPVRVARALDRLSLDVAAAA